MISTFCRYWLIPTGKTENPQKNRWIVHLQDGWYQHPMGGRAMICPVGQLKMPRSFPLWRPNSWIFTSVYRLFCLSGNQTWQFYAMFDYRRVSMNVFFLESPFVIASPGRLSVGLCRFWSRAASRRRRNWPVCQFGKFDHEIVFKTSQFFMKQSLIPAIQVFFLPGIFRFSHVGIHGIHILPSTFCPPTPTCDRRCQSMHRWTPQVKLVILPWDP